VFVVVCGPDDCCIITAVLATYCRSETVEMSLSTLTEMKVVELQTWQVYTRNLHCYVKIVIDCVTYDIRLHKTAPLYFITTIIGPKNCVIRPYSERQMQQKVNKLRAASLRETPHHTQSY